MSGDKVQGRLQKLTLICSISHASNSPLPPETKGQPLVLKKKVKGNVTAKGEGTKLVLFNEQTKADIIRYDCFDSVLDPSQKLIELFAKGENTIPSQLLQGIDTSVILFGEQGSAKTKEMLCSIPDKGLYSTPNLITTCIKTLMQSVKAPILSVSIAEIVANPGEGGQIILSLQDLLAEKKTEEEKNKLSEGLMKIQLATPEQFDYLIRYASEKSFGVLVPKEEEDVQIEGSNNTSLLISLYFANAKSRLTLLDMCGYKARYFRDSKASGKKPAPMEPAEVAINGLFQYLNQSTKHQKDEKGSDPLLRLYKDILGNKKLHFLLNINDKLQLPQIQPVLNAIENLSVNEYMIKTGEKVFLANSIKYAAYEKAKEVKMSQKKGKEAARSPRIIPKEQGKNKLVQSLKKLSKAMDQKKLGQKGVLHSQQRKVKRASIEDSQINKSYDGTANINVVLPQIGLRGSLKPTKGKIIAAKYLSVVEKKSSPDQLRKENETLRMENQELLARISELEGKSTGNEGKRLKGKASELESKKMFEYERKISNLTLNQQAMQIKLQENDKLITQLLQTIDYLNQGASKAGTTGKKSAKGSIEKRTGATEPEAQKSGQFLFNKSELVQSHTQIKQTKYMIFEGFKSLQAEIGIKHGEHGKIAGTIDYLLSNLDALFNIIHQLEIKELQYLNLLSNAQQATPKETSPPKGYK